MSFFIVRVELHGAGIRDTTHLNVAMKDHGFTRLVEVNGKWLWLLEGQYCLSTKEKIHIQEVQRRADLAVKSTRKQYSITVVEGLSFSCVNLSEASPADISVW